MAEYSIFDLYVLIEQRNGNDDLESTRTRRCICLFPMVKNRNSLVVKSELERLARVTS